MRNEQDCSKRTRARFGAFEADLASGELFRDGRKVAIQEKPFSLLSLLLRNQNFISRDEVFSRLWPNVYVQKDVCINTAIRRLRIALQDHGASPALIETVGSRGYRLKVPVEWRAHVDGNKRRGTPRVAIMPFLNLNGQEGDFFSNGLTEEMIAHLGQTCKNIAVIAPVSSWRLKHNSRHLLRVAQQLQADFVLSGSVSRMDKCLRVTARLIRSSDQSLLWTQSYLREDENVFAVQEEICDDIAREIVPAFECALHRG